MGLPFSATYFCSVFFGSLLLSALSQDLDGTKGGVYLFSNPYDNWTLPANAPLKGVLQKVKWADVEVGPDRWNWTTFDAQMHGGAKHGSIHLVFNTHTGAPDWLYTDLNVPLVHVASKTHGKVKKGSYPYYVSEVYQQRLANAQQKLCEHIATLSGNARPFEIFADSCPTGDTMPWEGEPLDPKLNISQSRFQAFLLDSTKSFIAVCSNTPILLNAGNPPYSAATLNFLAALRRECPALWYKGDRVGHGAGFNSEVESYDLIHDLLANGTARARAEGPEDGAGFWQEAPLWELRHLMAWALQFGLDYFNVHDAFAAEKANWPQFEWFNRWAGRIKGKNSTPGGVLLLHDGLDSSDTIRFPESKYGNASATNSDRYRAIVGDFADRGAGIEDISVLATEKQEGEHAKGMNDVGWRIWGGNYGRWIEQVDALTTSVGWWRIGEPTTSPLGYGRFGRGWASNSTMGMRFRLSSELWGGQMPHEGVKVEVVFYDGVLKPHAPGASPRTFGSWELRYETLGGGEAVGLTVSLDGKGSWKIVHAKIPLQVAGEFRLVPLAGTDANAVVFHSVEVTKGVEAAIFV